MKKTTRGAFTLIELMVVIAIIGILSGVLMASLGNAGESALAAKCLSNLRSLAQGANSIAMETGYYPFAGSCQHIVVGGKRPYYAESVGWISWLSMSHPFAGHPTKAVGGIRIPTYDMVAASDEARFAITNGTMYRAVNGNAATYVCPSQVKTLKKAKKAEPLWSYVMNGYFGYDTSGGSGAAGWGSRRKYGSLTNADRILLFAEIDFTNDGSDNQRDCTLQYKGTVDGKEYGSAWKGNPEAIGFNHRGPKGKYYAHVVFADGHVEKLAKGTSGELDEFTLTAALCEGKDVTFNGKSYELLK